MDKTSIFGLAIGLAAIIVGQVLEGGHPRSLMQATALLIVLGGTLGAVMLQSSFDTFMRGVRMTKWVFMPPVLAQNRMIMQISLWSQTARRDGLLALENMIAQLKDDPFSKKGLQLLVDGVEPERLREILNNDIDAHESQLRAAAKVWEAAGGYSPTIGILGAVLGLIHVMENLSDPSKLGAGIAVAFVATIYGVGLANLVFLPIANKLKFHIGKQVAFREMIIDGLMGVSNGENPRITEARMRAYVF